MDKKTLKALMSTGNGEYSTPRWLYKVLDSIFRFEIDLCAKKKNAKCKKFYSLKRNAFEKKWNKTSFCNPPYGSPQKPCVEGCEKKTCVKRGFHLDESWPGLIHWVTRGAIQSKKHGSTIVFLVPARTETKWFKIIWKYASAICFIEGRLIFNEDDENMTSAPFPSAIVVFGRKLTAEEIHTLGSYGPVISNWYTWHIRKKG